MDNFEKIQKIAELLDITDVEITSGYDCPNCNGSYNIDYVIRAEKYENLHCNCGQILPSDDMPDEMWETMRKKCQKMREMDPKEWLVKYL